MMRERNNHIWISPGALLLVVLTNCAIALLVIFVAVPFYQSRGDDADRRAAGVQLLQTFDCTYGRSLDGALAEVIKIQEDAAGRALITIKESESSGDEDREAAGRRSRVDAIESVGRVKVLREQLEPLSPTQTTCR